MSCSFSVGKRAQTRFQPWLKNLNEKPSMPKSVFVLRRYRNTDQITALAEESGAESGFLSNKPASMPNTVTLFADSANFSQGFITMRRNDAKERQFAERPSKDRSTFGGRGKLQQTGGVGARWV